MFKNVAIGSEDDEDSDNEVPVYEVGDQSSEGSEDSDIAVSDVEQDNNDDMPNARAWGKNKKHFYFTDYVDPDYGGYQGADAVNAELEEDEARNLQKQLMHEMDEDDFAFDFIEMDTKSEEKQSEEVVKTDISQFGKRQKVNLLYKESPEFFGLVEDFKNKVKYLLHYSTSKMSATAYDVWRKADAVCFDVDSTVIQEEGIDELAKFCGKHEDVAKLTSKAMSGKITFQESLALRLDILQPSWLQVKEFLKKSPPTLTPGIKHIIEFLHNKKVPVYFISGGFRTIVLSIAKQLNVPEDNVFANRLKFFYTGEYAGFDESQPTSRSGGKAVVINMLKKKFGYKNLVMIGDGVTDLEACPPADAFIGYGGNVIREEVKHKSQWFVTNFLELIQNLKAT